MIKTLLFSLMISIFSLSLIADSGWTPGVINPTGGEWWMECSNCSMGTMVCIVSDDCGQEAGENYYEC